MSYIIKNRLWIETKDHVFLGKGRVQLLQAIATHGSLSRAAKSLNLSYKKAWHLLDSVNKSAKKPVTLNTTGGKGGGGTILTDYGKSLITAFDEINKNCKAFLENQLTKFNHL